MVWHPGIEIAWHHGMVIQLKSTHTLDSHHGLSLTLTHTPCHACSMDSMIPRWYGKFSYMLAATGMLESPQCPQNVVNRFGDLGFLHGRKLTIQHA